MIVTIHKVVGFAIAGGFALLWIIGFGARILKKDDAGKVFWGLVAAMQVIAGIEAVMGIVLLVLGHQAPKVLHYAYGVFPIIAFIGAHAYARAMRENQRPYPYLPFALVGFVSMGLTMRAIMTGLGIG